jgi:hypothetical protein
MQTMLHLTFAVLLRYVSREQGKSLEHGATFTFDRNNSGF